MGSSTSSKLRPRLHVPGYAGAQSTCEQEVLSPTSMPDQKAAFWPVKLGTFTTEGIC